MNKYLLISLMFGAAVSNSYAEESMAAKGDIKAGEEKSAVCAACHGPAGKGVASTWPKLAGQHESYIIKQLNDFKNAKRKDPVMAPQAAMLSDQDIINVAAYFSSQPKPYSTAGVTNDEEQTKELMEIAEKLYRGGDSARSIASCSSCHGPEGLGIETAGYPALGGQYAQYVAKQLKDFRVDVSTQSTDTDLNSLVYRDNDPSKMMRNTAKQLTDKEIQALSYYVQGLQPLKK